MHFKHHWPPNSGDQQGFPTRESKDYQRFHAEYFFFFFSFLKALLSPATNATSSTVTSRITMAMIPVVSPSLGSRVRAGVLDAPSSPPASLVPVPVSVEAAGSNSNSSAGLDGVIVTGVAVILAAACAFVNVRKAIAVHVAATRRTNRTISVRGWCGCFIVAPSISRDNPDLFSRWQERLPSSKNGTSRKIRREVQLAERAGFEPANLCGLHAFQACALSQLRDLSVRRANYTIMKNPGSGFHQSPVSAAISRWRAWRPRSADRFSSSAAVECHAG